MNVSTTIKDQITRIDAGNAFTYDSLAIPTNQFIAASKTLSRLVNQGVIKRYQKGVYYKPKLSDFGELRPSDTELLKIYLFKNNKQVAYITGVRLYNELRLTTQVPNVIKIASLEKQIRGKVGNTVVRPAKSYVSVTEDKIPYLQLLDVAKDFKKIPDADPMRILSFLKSRIAQFSSKELKRFITFAKAYPPKVVALIGAILEFMGLQKESQALRKSINPLSTYTFGISEKLLPTTANWNII